MASLQQIISWFQTGLFPTADQFRQTWLSYWHKSEKIPQLQIFGLQETIESATRGLIYQNPVINVADLTTTYPNAKVGWAAMVTSVGYIYSFNGSIWANTGLKEFPEDVATKEDLFLLPDSDLTNYPTGSILEFIIQPTANIALGKEYYIKYLYNMSTPRFLLQIVDDNDTVVSQYYLPSNGLTGKQWLNLTNGSNGLPFANVYIDADKFTSGQTSFGQKLHLKASVLSFSSLTNAFMTPGGNMNINLTGSTITINIPASTRIYQANYNYLTNEEIILTETLNGIYYFVHNKTDKSFSLISVSSLNIDYRNIIILGEVNSFSQRQIINSTRYSVNGVVQEFISPASITAPYSFDKDAFASQKMAQILSNTGRELKRDIDFTYTFPFWAIREIKVIKRGDMDTSFYTDGVFKDLYLVYLRKKGISGNVSTIIQIGEKIGDEVGVNVNLWASFNSSDDVVNTIETYILKGTTLAPGLEIMITLDWTNLTSTTYTMSTQCPIYVPRLLQQARTLPNESSVYDSQIVPKKYSFWLNPTNTTFNYNSFIRLEAVSGDPSLFYKEDGTLRELYLTFIRLVINGSPSTNIVQIAWKDGDTVGINNKIFASSVSNDTRNMAEKPIAYFDLVGNTDVAKGVKFSCIIDTALLPASIIGSATLGGSLQLDTLLFVEQLKAVQEIQKNTQPILQGKKVVCFGDSVTEFGTYPEQIATITGATTYKIGFGGCRMGKRSGTSETILAYDELAMYKIAQSVANQDFTAMEAAIEFLKNKPSPDDNTAAFNRLKSIDFSTVDLVTIFFGTNDFTSNENPLGDKDSVDPMTMRGAINIVVNTLQTAYPNLRIAFITPTHRFWNGATWDDSDTVPNTLGLYLIEYCDAIIDQANYNHLPVLDMYRKGGFNAYNHEYYFGTDGVHPNSTGYTYLAQKFSAYLQTLFKF